MAAQPIAEAAVRIVADTAELEAALKSAEKAFTAFIAKWASIGVAAKEVFDALMEQERALRLVSAEMGLGREAAMAYVKSVDQIRLYWGFAREEAVKAATNIADAGYTAAESASILEEAMKLAGATGASLADVADVLASTMRAYNLSTNEAGRAAEDLFYILSAGRVTLEDLDLGFNRLLVVARPLGISLEELTASYTVMSQKTTETYNIYLALMGVIKAMINPTKQLQEILLAHGYASGLAALKSLGFLGVMKLLWDEMAKGNLRLQDIISDIRAVSGLASITSGDIEKMAQAFQELTRGETGYHEATRAFTESFIRQWNEVKETLKLVAADIGTIVLPALQGLLDVVKSLAGALKSVTAFELKITGVNITGQDQFKKAASTLQALALLALPLLGRKFAFGTLLRWLIPVEVSLEISKILARSTASPASTAEVVLRAIVAGLGAALTYAGVYTGDIVVAAGGIAISLAGQLILNLAFKPKVPVDVSKVLEEQVFKPFGTSMEELNQKVQEIAGQMTVKITPNIVSALPLPSKELLAGLSEASQELQKRFAEIKKENLTPDVYKALGFVFGKAMTDAFLDFDKRCQALAEAINRSLLIGSEEWGLTLSNVPTEFWAAFAYAQSTTLDALAARLADLGVNIQLISPQAVSDASSIMEAYLTKLSTALRETVAKFSESLAGHLIDGILAALQQGQDALEKFIAQVGGLARTIGPKAVVELIGGIDDAIKEIDKYGKVLGTLPPEYEKTKEALVSLRESIVGTKSPIEVAISSFEAQLEGVDFGGLAGGLWDVINAISGMKDVNWIVTLLRSEIEVRKDQPAQLLALSDAILTVLDKLREAASILESWGVKVPEKIQAGIAALSTFEKTTSLETELLKASFGGLQEMLYERIGAELEAGKSVDEVVHSLRVLAAAVSNNPAALKELADTATSLQKQLEDIAGTYSLALQPVPKRIQDSIAVLSKFTQAMKNSAEDLVASFQKARLPDLQERLLRLLVAVVSYSEVQAQASRAMEFFRNASSETSTFLYDFAKSVLQVSSSAESSSATLGLSLSQLSLTAENSADKLSSALDSVTASSQDLLTSFENISSQLPTLFPTVTAPALNIATLTAPAMASFSSTLEEISAKINQTAQTLTGLSQTVASMPGLFTNLQEQGGQLTLGLSFLQTQSTDLSVRIAMVATELQNLGEATKNLSETAKTTAQEMDPFTKVLAEAWSTLMEGAKGGADAAEKALRALAERLAKEAEGEGVNIAPLLQLIEVSQGLRDSLGKYLDFTREKQIPISKDLREKLEAAKIALDNFVGEVKDNTEWLKKLQSALQESINSVARAMGIEIPSSVSYAIDALLGMEAFNPVLFAIKAATDLAVFSLNQAKQSIDQAKESFDQLINSVLDLAKIFWELVTSSKPYADLMSMLSFVVGALVDTLFSFLWPLVAILRELGLAASDFLNTLYPLDQETEEVTKQAQTFTELNVPAGFKDLAARLEYLVARPGELYVPETTGGGGGAAPKPGAYQPPEVKIPAWAKDLIESFRGIIEEIKAALQEVLAGLLSFARAIAPSFTELLLSVIKTFADSLVIIVDWLNSTAAPILIRIFKNLTDFWNNQVAPWITSTVLPGLLDMFTAFLDFLNTTVLPFIENYVFPLLQQLWPLVEQIFYELLDVLKHVIGWLEKNWPLIEQWISNMLTQWKDTVLKGLELWQADMMAQAGNFWGSWQTIWQSQNLTFWEKVLAGWIPVQQAFAQGQIVLGLFFAALQVVMTAVGLAVQGLLLFVQILKTAIDIIVGAARFFWNVLADFIATITLGLVRLPKLQEGGIVAKPTVLMAGEAGPEAIIPLPEFNALISALNVPKGVGGEFTLVNEIHLEVDGRELAAIVKRQEVREAIIRGRW